MKRWIQAAMASLALGCASCTSYSHLYFVPPVQDVELRAESGQLEARLVVAWRGIHEGDGAQQVHFRVRIENAGFEPFTLEPAEFELLDGALEPCGTARVPPLPGVVDAGSWRVIDLVFPIEDEKLERSDLSSLTLRTRLQGGRWGWSSTFQLAEPYDPYGYPAVSIRVGAAWSW